MSSSTQQIGFAIVGCGMIARFHARALAEVPDARLAALVSRREANARSMAEELGLNCVLSTDLNAVLARPDVHAVIITTPSGAHLEPAVAAAKAGKHVVVEKPLEITTERCDRIIEACDRHGVKLCTIFPSRFGDANRALKEAVEAGRFGRLTLGETTCKWWRPQSYYDEGGWKGTQGARRRRRPDEPGHPQCRSVIVDDGRRDAHQRLHRDAGPRAHRGGRHRRGLPAFRQRRSRRHPGDHQRPSRAAENHRRPRRSRHAWSSSRTTCCAGS